MESLAKNCLSFSEMIRGLTLRTMIVTIIAHQSNQAKVNTPTYSRTIRISTSRSTYFHPSVIRNPPTNSSKAPPASPTNPGNGAIVIGITTPYLASARPRPACLATGNPFSTRVTLIKAKDPVVHRHPSSIRYNSLKVKQKNTSHI